MNVTPCGRRNNPHLSMRLSAVSLDKLPAGNAHLQFSAAKNSIPGSCGRLLFEHFANPRGTEEAVSPPAIFDSIDRRTPQRHAAALHIAGAGMSPDFQT